MEWNVGDIVEGKITGISKFGAFVEMAPGAVGLVHISEISTEYVSDIGEIYSVGDQVKAKVISTEKGKISLSIKQLSTPAPKKKEFKEKKQHTPRPKYQSPGRPGDVTWEIPAQDADMSFEDKLSKFKMTSDEKLFDLKKKNGADGRRRSKRGAAPII
ncbi:MAG: S1 RNA-binding domain-containing protein [Clostridia bacterium]|nr:S1 RNA-binding domain-containing protein [Clostridia bacterium]